MNFYAETLPAGNTANTFKIIADALEAWEVFGDWEEHPVREQRIVAIRLVCRLLQMP